MPTVGERDLHPNKQAGVESVSAAFKASKPREIEQIAGCGTRGDLPKRPSASGKERSMSDQLCSGKRTLAG